MNRTIKIGGREMITGIRCERHSGPGWSNRTVTVHIVNLDTNMWRSECLQPYEFTPVMHAMFHVESAAFEALRAEVEGLTMTVETEKPPVDEALVECVARAIAAMQSPGSSDA